MLELSGTQNLVSICNLQPGETYKLIGFNPADNACSIDFSIDGVQEVIFNTIMNQSQPGYVFKATETCAEVELISSNCGKGGSYPANLSINCITCTPSSKHEEDNSSSSRLPVLAIDQSLSAEELIADIFIGGDCFDVSNVSTIGTAQGRGMFLAGGTSVGLDKGVILSTGNVNNAPGPCTAGNASSSNGGNSDPDLAQLAGINVGDASGIEFDFVPTLGSLSFDYVFASEEYCEFVGQFNDVFGFFISGPGINGPYSNNAVNIAQIPGTNTEVAINTVNHNTNTQFFVSNSTTCSGETNCPDIRYDGFTTVFTAFIDGLDPCETYHIKLVVGDASDQAWDSAVFLGNGSFDAGGELNVQSVVPNGNGNIAIEACQDGQFIFTRNAVDIDQPLTVNFSIGGTATPGLDFTPFPTSITFPPGQQLFIIDVEILSDALAEGDETITLILDQDACTCSGQAGELIIQDYVPFEVNDGDVTVCGQTGSTLLADVVGGAPNFFYAWSNGSSTESITVSPSTTTVYTVTVTDQCGSTEEGSYTVNVLSAPTATISGDAVFCEGDPNPTATLTVTFTGQGPWDLTYFFNGVQQPQITGITDNPFDLVVSSVGNYALSAVVNQFCSGTVSGLGTVSEVDVELAIVPTPANCNGQASGSVDLTVTGGDPTYTYNWSNSNTSEDLFNVPTGPYSVTVTDINGCTEEASTTVTEPPVLNAIITEVAPVNCAGDMTGAIDLTVTGGSPNYNYVWSNGSTNEDVSMLGANTYSVTITDQNNCNIITSLELTEPEAIISNIDVLQNVTCAGGDNGAVDLTVIGGTSPFFYNWSNSSSEEDPFNFEEGSYTVVVTDVNGCTVLDAVNITEPPPIIAQAVETAGVDCNNPNGGSADLVVAGGVPGYTYLWDNGSTEEDPDNLSAGDHTVTVTDLNGCQLTANVNISSNTEEPTVSIDVSGQISCTTGDVSLDGSGSTGSGTLSYEWQDDNGDVVGTDPSIDVSTAGNYTLIVTAGNGCTSSSDALVSEDSNVPEANAVLDGELNCSSLSATLDGTGSTGAGLLDYEWQDENGDVVSSMPSTSISNPGMYTLIVLDTDNGCADSITIDVGQDITPPLADAQTSGLLNCVDLEVNLDGSGSSGAGPLSYQWLDGSNTSIGSNSTIDVNQSETYTLIVTDGSNGCTAETTVFVDQNTTEPTVDTEAPDLLTCEILNTDLDASGSTGIGTLSYEWQNDNGDNIGSLAQVNVSTTGDYTVIITDAANGCTASAMVTVNEDVNVPTAVANDPDDLTCTITTVNLDASGSSANGTIAYEWQNDNGDVIASTVDVDVSQEGTYTLIITDTDNGCSQTTNAQVVLDAILPNPDATADGTLTCANLDVTLDGSGSTGTGALNYAWTNSGGNNVGTVESIDITEPDTYTLVITDTQNGCTSEATITVDQDIAQPTSDAGSGTSLTCVDTEVTLDGGNSSTGANISYEWFNNGNVSVGSAITVDVTETGTYTLVVTNEDNGCTDSSTVEVTPDASLPTADAGTGATLTCAIDQVTLDGAASSSGGNISYQWLAPNNDPISTDLSIDVANTGTYTLIVTNTDNGCSATASVEVDEDITPPMADAGTTQFITCTDTEVTLDGVGSTGNSLTYEWFDEGGNPVGATQTIDVSSAEVYTLVVTDNTNGCTGSTTVEVETDADVPVADAGADGLLTCLITEYTLDASNSNGGTLAFEWQNEAGDVISNLSTTDVSLSGTYTLIVTNTDNGCTSSSTALVNLNNTDPIANAGADDILSCNITEVTLDASASTGTVLDYEWQNEQGTVIGSTSMLPTTDVGTYTVLVTDTDNGCTATDQVIISGDYETPVVDPGLNGLLTCEVLSVTLDASGSSATGTIAFEWFDDNSMSIANTEIVDVNQIGTYTVVVTNTDNGCTEMSTVDVSENITTPMSNAGQGATLTCDDTSVTLAGTGSSQSGNTAFEWFNEGGVSIGTTASVTVDQTGTYTLIVTDTDNGCTMASTVTVVPDANLPTANAGQSSTLTCVETLATLDGSNSSSGADISYEWQDELGANIGSSLMLDVNTPGIYTLIVSDGSNGCTASSSVEIFENIESPNTQAGLNQTLTCDETSVTLDGSGSSISTGALSYEWMNEAGDMLGNTATIIVDVSGVYTLITTGDNGCTSTDQVEVLVDADVPVADVGLGGTLDCNVSVITLGGNATTVGPDISYEWQDGTGAAIANTITTDISVPGTYTLVVFNASNNCETSAAISIPQDINPPVAEAGPTETLTCTLTDYQIGGNSSVGTEFIYEWTNEAGIVISNDMTTNVSTPDTYTLTVSNTINGCTTQSQVIVDQDVDTPVAAAGQGGVLTCDITEITLDGSNSTGANLAYEWLNESGVVVSTNVSFPASETGDYTLIVTNTANGCSASSMATITPDANLPDAQALTDGILTCANGSVMLDGSASSSISGNIAFEWLDENSMTVSNTDIFSTSTPGVYTLIVTDTDNACTASMSVEVQQDITPPMAEAGATETLTCDQTEVTLNGVGSNGTNLSFEWQDAIGTTLSSTASVTVSVAGTYIFIVTNDDNGCSSSDVVTVIPDTNLPTADAGTSSTLTCAINSVMLDGSASSTGANIVYEWQDAIGNTVATTMNTTVSTPGLYTLIVTNVDNNCQSQAQVNIIEDTETPDAFASFESASSLDCNNTSIILDGSASQPFGQLSFEWTTSDGNIASGETTINPEIDESGTYILIVTNTINGCTDSQQIVVDENTEAPVALINNPDILTCIMTEVAIDATGSSSIGDFTYNWTGSGIISGETTLTPIVGQSGNFTLTILDNENGCETTASIMVEENTTPPVAVASTNEQFDCLTESVSLSGEGSSTGPDFSYVWTGAGDLENETSLSPTVFSPGTYTLIVTNAANGCTQTNTVNVLEDDNIPTGVTALVDNPLCFGDDGTIAINEVIGGTAPYLYSLDNGANFSSQIFYTNLEPGNYDLIIQDANGCEYSEALAINGVIELDVSLDTDVLLQFGDNYQLNALVNIPLQDIDTIIWTPAEGLSCTDCLNPSIDTILETAIYSVTVINQNGCSDTDEITLRVSKEKDVYIPNAFTPGNQDGINDRLTVFGDESKITKVNSLQIFNRWGELVFENRNFFPNDEALGWDGTFRGERLNPAVYVFWAEVEFIDGSTEIFKGDVTLVE